MSELQLFFDRLKKTLTDDRVPLSSDEFFDGFLIDEATFVKHEGELWDYKEEWPSSLSDNYFYSLSKLVASFANNLGGLIIFNIRDYDKKYCQSEKKPNPDRFITACKNLMHNPPNITYIEYKKGSLVIPTIIVFPKFSFELPTYLTKWKGRNGLFWFVREGYESVTATTKKIPILFCRYQVRNAEIDSDLLEASIPPSPATLRQFVSRFEIIDNIFDWIHDQRQPRCFLYGRGGSGKTTIAYEVARYVSEYNCELIKGNCFDCVIFISAKSIELNVFDLEQVEFSGTDFSNAKELFQAILITSGWYIDEDVDGKQEDELLDILEEMFNAVSAFIVVDDIDTLTTQGQDAGLEALILVLARAKKISKLLYTLRNAPTYALRNAIQVPGFRDETEINDFFDECRRQFRVPIPSLEDKERILRVTEGRPLGIESVMALRRSSKNYNSAIQAFEEHAGDNARAYVFEREWAALNANHRGRNLLAALALVKKPLSFDELGIILKYDEDSLQQAISETLEMFIEVEESDSGSKYSLGELTRRFVLTISPNLPRFEEVKERVATFKRTFHPKLPELNNLRAIAERLLFEARRYKDESRLLDAWQRVTSTALSEKVRQNPHYMELAGLVGLSIGGKAISEARSFLLDANKQGHRIDLEVLRNWYWSENDAGLGDQYCPVIKDIVFQNRAYSEFDRVEISLLEGSRLYNNAKAIRFDNPDRSVDLLKKACLVHLNNLKRASDINHIKVDKIHEYARNTAFLLFNEIKKMNDAVLYYNFIRTVFIEKNIVFDPLIQPIIEYMGQYSEEIRNKSVKSSILSAIGVVRKNMKKTNRWIDDKNIHALEDKLGDVEALVMDM